MWSYFDARRTRLPKPLSRDGGPTMSSLQQLKVPSEHLDRCAQEPVQLIGQIQPHGLLFALSEPDLLVRQVSANVASLLGMAPEFVLGQPFEAVLGTQQFAEFRSLARSSGGIAENPIRVLVGESALEMEFEWERSRASRICPSSR
jgi:light-regulated signal transduction histidine kinase (bacteriophytochrome)